MRLSRPRRNLAVHSSSLVVLALLLRAVATGAQTPIFPGGTELVVVDVIVTDADGRPVTGLTREDFTVEDEAVRQEIVEFEGVDATRVPEEERPRTEAWSRIATNDSLPASARSFLIVFDDLRLSPASGERVRGTLQKFLQRQLRDTDCVTIAPTGGGAWWSGCLAGERADIAAFVGRLQGK